MGTRCCTVGTGGLTKGYDIEDKEWKYRAEQMAEKWVSDSNGGKDIVILFIEGDKLKEGSFTQVVACTIELFRRTCPAAIIRLVVTLSDAAEWPIPANPSPDDWSDFGVPVAAVIVFNASCLAAVMTDKEAREIYKQCWGDPLYGESDAEGVEGPRIHSTGSYFMLACLTLHFRRYLSREHGVTMCQKKFLLTDKMSEQIRRDVLSPRQPDEYGRFSHVPGSVTIAEMLYERTVPFDCSRRDKEMLENSPVPLPQDTIQIHKEQVQPRCTTITCGAQCGECCLSCRECEYVFDECSEHVMDTVPGGEALECPWCKTVAMSEDDNVNGEQADY